MIGTRVGVYEVAARLGAGAMGEVYRGRDTRLGRDVAIKVLPQAFTSEPERLARFEREAKLLASLNHPNVATIYGLEESNGAQALVMELIDGEDLGQRIARGPLPLAEALDLARQIASALDAAHERGVIHRDLKPANILITREGQVKVVDFGLAKSFGGDAASGSGPSAGSMTATSAGTIAGVILGTAAYMSPEQARGKAVDRRTDVWAFGCVVYEMLTGKTAFAGETVTDVLAAIVHEDPDWSALPAAARPRLARLLRRCLVKDMRERMSDLGDVALILREIATEKPTPALEAAPVAAATSRASWLIAAGIAAVALAAGFMAGRGGGAPAASASGIAPASFKQLTFTPGAEGLPAISPDGQSFAFIAGPVGKTDIFVQRVDGRNAVNLTAGCAEDDTDPAFSPDGRLIAYHSDCAGGGLFVMGATGESSRKVSDGGYSPAWSPDGREIAVVTEQVGLPSSRLTTSELWAVNVETGKRRKVSDHDAMQPSWSPDGKRIAFWGLPESSSQRDLYTAAADGSQAEINAAVRVTDDPELDWNPVWAPDGKHLYFSSSRGGTFNIWRIPIDQDTGGAAGVPTPMTAPSSWVGWLSLSQDGRRLLFVDRNARTTLYRAPFDVARAQMTGPPVPIPLGTFEVSEGADLSPDGGAIVFANAELPQHLFIVKVDGTGLVQLTDGAYRDRQPSFSPDGAWIAFQTNRFPSTVGLIRPDGSGLRAVPSSDTASTWYPWWSPDGKRLVVSSRPGSFIVDPFAETPTWTLLGQAAGGDKGGFWSGSFSPDGRSVLGVISDAEGGSRTLAIRTLPGGEERALFQVPRIGQPRFLPDGKRFLVDAGDRILVGDVGSTVTRELWVLPSGHTTFTFSLSGDYRWIAWLDAVDESDIWMATLESDDEAGR
jgi:Tol biopolymer transport system component/predicted Ser/Thr protein kinase